MPHMPAASHPHQGFVVKTVAELLRKGNAHVPLDRALKDIPFELLGIRAGDGPHSIWELAEHIRIAQWDLLEFSRNPTHESPPWPEGYWPGAAAPPSPQAWQKTVDQIVGDRDAFIHLVETAGDRLYEIFPHGTGQSLLQEALVLADHNSYHAGQVVLIRKMLGNWK